MNPVILGSLEGCTDLPQFMGSLSGSLVTQRNPIIMGSFNECAAAEAANAAYHYLLPPYSFFDGFS